MTFNSIRKPQIDSQSIIQLKIKAIMEEREELKKKQMEESKVRCEYE
jgi:hypothetical protein